MHNIEVLIGLYKKEKKSLTAWKKKFYVFVVFELVSKVSITSFSDKCYSYASKIKKILLKLSKNEKFKLKLQIIIVVFFIEKNS